MDVNRISSSPGALPSSSTEKPPRNGTVEQAKVAQLPGRGSPSTKRIDARSMLDPSELAFFAAAFPEGGQETAPGPTYTGKGTTAGNRGGSLIDRKG